MDLSILIKDEWISDVLKNNVYFLNSSLIKEKTVLFKSIEHLNEIHLEQKLFIYTKVKTDLINQIQIVEDLGFRLIDTNIIFKRDNRVILANDLNSDVKISFEDSNHKSHIVKLAFENFIFSRFHLDPLVEDKSANNLKKKWVENYFSGKRGDQMVVALKNNRPVGFLLLIKEKDNLIIDLIAVKKNFRGGKIGSMMIYFLFKKISFKNIIVGTQISNIPSVKLYQKLGFKLISSQYVFHYHKR